MIELIEELDRIKRLDAGQMIVKALDEFGMILTSRHDGLIRRQLSYLVQRRWHESTKTPLPEHVDQRMTEAFSMTDEEYENKDDIGKLFKEKREETADAIQVP